MNMKRFLVVGILGLVLISMMSLVLGAKTGAEVGAEAGEAVKGGVEGGRAFLEAAFGDIAFGDYEWLSKFFFAILLGMIIYTVVSSFFAESGAFIQWGITIAVSAIAFIGIPADFLEALRVSYGAMGLTILTVVPFLIMAVFTVKVKDLVIARGIWAFYSFYYFFLIIGKWLEIVDFNENILVTDPISTAPYWIAILGGAIMFFTIPYIRNMFSAGHIDAEVELAEAGMKKQTAAAKLKAAEDLQALERLKAAAP